MVIDNEILVLVGWFVWYKCSNHFLRQGESRREPIRLVPA